MACATCGGRVDLGTEAAPILLGDETDGVGVRVVLRSPIIPGSSWGMEAWVTGSRVEVYTEAGLLELAPEPAPVLAAAAPEQPAADAGTVARSSRRGGATDPEV